MNIETVYRDLKQYIEDKSYSGWDPFDGLNSVLFNSLPIISSNRLAKIAFTQFNKRSPLNFRRLFGIKEGINPKALGLVLSSYCREYRTVHDKELLAKIRSIAKQVILLRSDGWSGVCWGYNFPWQARAFFQPKYAPTVVATVFVASGLLDAYEVTDDNELLACARSACDFILKDLHKFVVGDSHIYSYSPYDNSRVYNASLLGSRLLARVYSFTKEEDLLAGAKSSVKYCCDQQAVDGSWSYGDAAIHRWVDSFHTGYNLEALNDYAKYSGDASFNAYIAKGLEYYVTNFFAEGVPKYYNNSVFPVDIHSPAQLVVTLRKLGKLNDYRELVDKVLRWTLQHMYDDEKHLFYYQMNGIFVNKIPYMRWSQTWMLYALSNYLYE